MGEEKLIISKDMAFGYYYLRERVKPAPGGQLMGQGARGLLHQCLNGKGDSVLKSLTDPRVRLLTIPASRPCTKNRPFILNEIPFEVHEHRPSGWTQRSLNGSRALPRKTRQRKGQPPILLWPCSDTRWLLDPRNRQMLMLILPFQETIPSIAIDIFSEALQRLQRVNQGGVTIVLVDGQPQRQPRRL